MITSFIIGIIVCLGFVLTAGTSCRSCNLISTDKIIALIIGAVILALVLAFFKWLDKK